MGIVLDSFCNRMGLATTCFLLIVGNLVSFAQETAVKNRTNYPGGTWQPGPAKYQPSKVEDFSIPMDDGTVLQASVARPLDLESGKAVTGQFPVLVEMTPYNQTSPLGLNAFFVEHGYIYAVVRPRGTGSSTGETQQFTSRDGLDGKAVVDWAAHRLNGSDGRVGLVGCSYPGGTALATAAQVGNASPVKAIIAACIGLDMQHSQVWTTNGLPNGALSAYAPFGGTMMGASSPTGPYFKKFYDGVLAGGAEAYSGYWKDRLPLNWAKKIADNHIPVLLWGGWQDLNETGAEHAYTALQNAMAGRAFYAPLSPSTPVSPRVQIILGDWAHGQGLDMGVYLEWLETWLKGVDTGLEDTKLPMHLFEEVSGNWINVRGYPLTETYTKLSFGSDASLQKTKPSARGEYQLTWGDPESEHGKLRFETAALSEGGTLGGPMSVTVYARSSNTNLEMLTTLYDVAADRTARRITKGGVLGSQHELIRDWSWADNNGTIVWPWPNLESDKYLTPGRTYRFDIPLAARQWSIEPGHRLRLELTTQSPASICPATGQIPFAIEPCKLTAPQQRTLPGGVYTVLYGSANPSSLNVPLLPLHAFPGVRAGRTDTAPAPAPGSNKQSPPTLPLDWSSGKQN